MEMNEKSSLLYEMFEEYKHIGNETKLNKTMVDIIFKEHLHHTIYFLMKQHIKDSNSADFYGKHDFGTGIKLKHIMGLKPNEGMYCMQRALEDAKKKLPNASDDKKILYSQIIYYYTPLDKKLILIKDTMLKPNFTTMKKISSCQIECEKALALIDKMIENQDRDSIYDSQDNPVGYEICVDRLEGVAMDDDDDYYTPEEQETASKLQDELQANNIQSIIHFI